MGVYPHLEYDGIMLIYFLVYGFYIYGAFDFSRNFIVILWRLVWYHYHTCGYPIINISIVICIIV